MKKSIFGIAIISLMLSGCDFGKLTQIFDTNEPTQNANNDNETGGNTSGETTTGGETTGGSTTGGETSYHDYTETWPEEYRLYVKTFLNGMLPCYLNVNKKCLFTNFDTGCVEQSTIPFFNPYVKNTSPSINYTYDYGGILRNAGFSFDGNELDEEGKDVYYYHKGYCEVQYSKYKGDDNIYYFDVYAYYDYTSPLELPNSKLSLDVESMGLTAKYVAYSKTIGSYTLSGTDIMKQSYDIQLKSNTGKLIITGPSKGVAFIISRNADKLFVKYGPNKNSLKQAFNEGGTFNFDSQANYIEIYSGDKVVCVETIDVLN